MQRRGIFLLIALILVLAPTSWAGGRSEEASAEAASSTIEVEEWKIPFLNCLTGPIASIGEYLQWGAERAAYEINQAGGIAGRPVRIIPHDTGVDPAKGTVEMAKIAEQALVALGPVPEAVIMAAMPIAVQQELFSFTATTSYEFAVKYFPWSISWFSPTEKKLPPIATAWAERFPEMTRALQFVENYGPWPGMAAAHEIGLREAGVEVLPPVEVPSDVVTVGPLVVKALAQNPQGMIFACHAERAAKIILELQNRGWKDNHKLLVFNSADDAPLYATGGAGLNGVMIYNYTNPELDSPRWNAFQQAYARDHNGMSPPSLSTHYYDAVYMIKEAIEKTGVGGDPQQLKQERRKIADYCRNVKNFAGLLFSWSMKDGIPTDKPLFLFEIREGRKHLVAEVVPE